MAVGAEVLALRLAGEKSEKPGRVIFLERFGQSRTLTIPRSWLEAPRIPNLQACSAGM